MQMVEHHIKYKEIHGVDETVWMTKKEHVLLHQRLRKEGKCKVPLEKMRDIAFKAHCRTEKAKIKHRDDLREYNRKNIRTFDFATTLEPKIYLKEYLTYNTHTGSISFGSYFSGRYGTELYYVEST